MKNNKFITAIIVILILAIMVVFGFLIYYLLKDSFQTVNDNIVNEQQENQTITNNIQNNNTNSEGNNENLEEQNLTIIEPITLGDDETQDTENLASTYYYSQLDDNAKIIYNGLKENKDNLMSGNYVIDYDKKFNTLLNSENGEEKLAIAFQSAWNAFSYDNVDLFYIDVNKMILQNECYNVGGIKTYKISIGPGENSNYFQSTFKTEEEVKAAKNYLENIKKQMIEQTKDNDDYTKIAKVHNWLIYFINYDDTENSTNKYTIYGALKNGKAVCEGYARAFKYLMDGVGVPCVLVSGTGTNSQGTVEEHAWNYVMLNEIWYGIDVTWDDPIVTGGEQTTEMKTKYFLKGSETFSADHKEEGVISENSMTFKFPTLATSDYTK